MQAAYTSADQIEVLRKTLQDVLLSIDAMTPATSCERAAVEEKRQKVLQLLAELSSPLSVESHPHLVSPALELDSAASYSTVSDATQGGETHVAEPVDFLPLPQHRLLGNVFSRPVPLRQGPSKALESTSFSAGDSKEAKTTCPHFLMERVSPQSTPSSTHLDSLTEPCESTSTRSYNERQEEAAARVGRANGAMTPEVTSSCRAGDDDEGVEHSNARVAPLRGARPSPPRRDVCLYDYACVTPSFWIHIWPCFGNAVCFTSRPTRVLVRGCYRYFEDVVERAAAQTNCQPACPFLYTPEGCPVRELERLVAEQHYLLFPSGGFYRKQAVPTALLWLLYRDARRIIQCA